jgi:hypothetical protein
MAAEPLLPAIILTDPNNDPASPSRAFSPTKDAPGDVIPPPDVGGVGRGASGRPETPSRKPGGSMRPLYLIASDEYGIYCDELTII